MRRQIVKQPNLVAHIQVLDRLADFLNRAHRRNLIEAISNGKLLLKWSGMKERPRTYPLKVLLEACNYYIAKKRRMTFEYILIAGVYDTDEHLRLGSQALHQRFCEQLGHVFWPEIR
jgi:hypothetical protein